MFQLYEEGHTTPFEQLIGCMLSIRTRDEAMYPAAKRLFAQAHTPQGIVNLGLETLKTTIATVGLYQNKAENIFAIAQQLVDKHQGTLGCDRELMLSFKGVGPKCANLTLGIACAEPLISVDVHVHRICNRWGYVQTNNM